MNSYYNYNMETAAGCTSFAALVAGANAGGAIMPAAENASGYLGHAQDATVLNDTVSVARGRVRAIAAGAITHGHYVRIANALGQVEDCQAAVDLAPGSALEINVIGKADGDAVNPGDMLMLITADFVVKTAAS